MVNYKMIDIFVWIIFVLLSLYVCWRFLIEINRFDFRVCWVEFLYIKFIFYLLGCNVM